MRCFILVTGTLLLSVNAECIHAQHSTTNPLITSLHQASTVQKIKINYEIGSSYFDTLPDSAIYYFKESLGLAQDMHNDTFVARCLNKIGNLEFNAGNYDDAIDHIYTALNLFEQHKDQSRMMRCMQYLAMAYEEQGMYDKALEFAQQSLEMAMAIDDPYSAAFSLTTLGSIHYSQSNYDKALDYFQESLHRSEVLADTQGIADALNNVALIYEKKHQLEKALEYHLRSLALAKELGDGRGIAASYHNIGLVYKALKEYEVALPYLDSCIVLVKAGDDKFYLKESYQSLAGLYSDMGEYEKAYQTHLLYAQLNDTLMSQENKRQFAEMNTRYETEKKDQQIILLDKDRKFQKTIRNGFVSGFLVVLLFAGVFFMQRNNISKARKRSDELLLNILPEEVADELKANGKAEARQFDEVTVLFTDFKNFTAMSEVLTPQELVNEINYCYSEFDSIITRYGIEKIKTIGDSYMCVGGLPVASKTHAVDVIKAAMEIRDFMLQEKKKREEEGKQYYEIRIGCHTGPVVAGIVGTKKFAYDIWGDTVNIASRMESSGEPGKINISGATYELLKDHFTCIYRGKIQAKNKGEIDMYFVERN
jgi:adenylate cyclase